MLIINKIPAHFFSSGQILFELTSYEAQIYNPYPPSPRDTLLHSSTVMAPLQLNPHCGIWIFASRVRDRESQSFSWASVTALRSACFIRDGIKSFSVGYPASFRNTRANCPSSSRSDGRSTSPYTGTRQARPEKGPEPNLVAKEAS